jgi:hypothetical protein
MRTIRIAQVAPSTEEIPPALYGGTERVVHWLSEQLVASGTTVTLFASGDSRTSGKLEAPWPRALRLDGSVRDPNALHMLMLERVRQRVNEFDFLHLVDAARSRVLLSRRLLRAHSRMRLGPSSLSFGPSSLSY